jgi:hypothetical protein
MNSETSTIRSNGSDPAPGETVEKESIVKYVKRRFHKLETIRKPWEKAYQLVADFVAPSRQFMFDPKEMQGMIIGKKMHDSYPVIALNLLVNGFQGHLVSPSILWFSLRFEDSRIMESEAAKQWIQDVTNHIYGVFEGSRYYDSIHDYIRDCASFGTSDLYTEEDVGSGEPIFMAIPVSEFYIAENRKGIVDTVFRKFNLSAREILKEFGKENLSGNVFNAAKKSSTMDDEFELIHAVFPNADREMGRLDSKNKAFSSVYIEANVDENKKKILRESGYDEMPHSVWRWEKNSYEWYGRSPAMMALVDIQRLNALSRNVDEASEIAVKPPMMVPAGHRGRVRLVPGGFNYYETLSQEEIRPIHTLSAFPIGLDREQEMKKIIDKHFMVDFFLLLTQSERQMTATEVMEKQGEKAAILGTVIGKLESECLDPIIERVYTMELKAGRLPPVPDELLQYGGAKIKIDYVGPLAQIQRRLLKTRGTTASLEVLQLLFNNYPEARDKINPLVIVEEVSEAYGMTQKALRSDADVEKIREARAQMEEQMQQAAMQKEAADAVPKISKKPEEGSILDQLLGRNA